MNNSSKGFSVFFILIMAISSLNLIMVESATAQSIPKPSVPEFTIKLVNHILNFPPTSSIDPFTGKQTIYPSSSLEWTTIDLTINNQNFNGKTEFGLNSYIGMMYAVEFKGHFVNDWQQLGTINGEGAAGPYFIQEAGSVTTVSLEASGGDINTITIYAPNSRPDSVVTIPEGGQADFRIKAMAGHAYKRVIIPFDSWHFNGTESEWSNTQTITFNKADAITEIVQPSAQSPTPTLAQTPSPTNSMSPSNTQLSPTPTPTVPELPFILIVIIIVELTLTLSVFKRKVR